MQQTLYLCTVFKRLKIFHKFVWFRLVVSNVILRVDILSTLLYLKKE